MEWKRTLFAYTAVAGSDALTHLRWSLPTGGGLGDDGALVVVRSEHFMVSEELVIYRSVRNTTLYY